MFKPSRSTLIRCILSLLLVAVVACGSDESGSSPSGTKATIPPENESGLSTTNAADVLPTVTLTATPLPQPIIIGQATITPAVQPPPSPTPLVTATALNIPGLIGPTNFPANVNPLTGLVVADPEALQQRPLAVKISNIARVRPQSGLNSADLVYEHYSEGGITRFTAVFFTNEVDKVGSVRSARLLDKEIAVMYDAGFAYSGSSGPLRLMFRDSIFFDRIISPDFGHGGFERISDPNNPNEFFEDTLFTSTFTLHAILDQRGQNTAPRFQNGMAFHADPPSGGTPAESLEVDYLATNAFWQYSPGTGRYNRWSDGVPHLDANTGQQLNFKNIIVLAAHHEDTDIVEDTNGFLSIQIQVWGEGPVSIFRDGQRFDGRWKREDASYMLTFYDLDGNVLPLSPGNTFIQVVPLGFSDLFVTP